MYGVDIRWFSNTKSVKPIKLPSSKAFIPTYQGGGLVGSIVGGVSANTAYRRGEGEKGIKKRATIAGAIGGAGTSFIMSRGRVNPKLMAIEALAGGVGGRLRAHRKVNKGLMYGYDIKD